MEKVMRHQVFAPLLSLLLALMLGCLIARDVVASEWPEVVQEVKRDNRQTLREVAQTGEMIQSEQKALQLKLADAKQQVAVQAATLQKLKEQFETLRLQEEELQAQLRQEEHDFETLEGVFRSTAEDLHSLLKESMISAKQPQRIQQAAAWIQPDYFIGYADFKTMVDLFLGEMADSGEVALRSGSFVGEDGRPAEGEILRVGKFTQYYRSAEKVGFLEYNRSSAVLEAVPSKLSWNLRRSLKRYFEGQSDRVAVDISRGAVFQKIRNQWQFREWLAAGGFLVWPILLIGGVAVLIVINRLYVLWRARLCPLEQMQTIEQLVTEGRMQDCQRFCHTQKQVPACLVLADCFSHLGEDIKVIEKVFYEAISKQMARLERFLPTLNILGAISPLLGLLGTVTGMITMFRVITLFGTGDPRSMSGGISEALVTTQLGLAVAIPILLVHHLLERRLETLLTDMDEKSVALTSMLLEAKKIK
jgi:biopolymer transport protein ExbB